LLLVAIPPSTFHLFVDGNHTKAALLRPGLQDLELVLSILLAGADSAIDDGRLHQDSKTCARVSPASLNRFQM
jgi:hypothetical protein